MGIKGLTNQIKEKAPESVRVEQLKNYFGRIIAIDASTAIYQFLIAVRTGEDGNQLKNQMGEVTSHLQGMFYRTIRLIVNGIKPVYVFDGKAPEFKSEELAKRREKREKAQADFEKAKEAGDSISSAKFQKRTVRATKEHVEDCKRLLKLMGIPYIEAPSEAEAQCAVLCKSKKVYAVASEDMDTLTFGSPRMIRNLTSSQAKQKQILEFDLEKVLKSFKLTMDQFIDFSILCGCDYTDTIAGAIASHKAYRVSENFRYEEARNLFKNPQVIDPNEITFKWSDPDPQGLIEYLCKEKGFQQERIEKGIEKLQKARKEPVQSQKEQKEKEQKEKEQKEKEQKKEQREKEEQEKEQKQKEKEQKQKEKEQKQKEQKKEQKEKEQREKEQREKEQKVDQKVDQKEQKEKEKENKKEKRKNHSKKRKKKKDLKKDSVKKEKQQKQKRKTRSSKRK
ncbi:flap endonuclease 1 [Anaeramoeba ignava]|uniref:Flap endonuclease 1 n=1 Tax=Anaeramoeba ignava TaxID=1746090 RepID=A0A9Q0L519_ANAIG|nr:flap endonuclease 1 [Anaeramoeba ignava]